MAGFFFEHPAYEVISSFTPYLGPRGLSCIAALQGLKELLQAEAAQKALAYFRLLGEPKSFPALKAEEGIRPNPFTLFLVLFLLLLADDWEGAPSPPGGSSLTEEAGS